MKILFISYIPDFSNLFILFCSLSSILDNNLLYIILTTIIILGGLSHIKYSNILQGARSTVKVVLAGGAAKAGADLYDFGKEKVKDYLEDKKKDSKGGSGSTPTSSSNTSSSNSSNTNGK